MSHNSVKTTSDQEAILLRFFRCLSSERQQALLLLSLRWLGKQYSLHDSSPTNQDFPEETSWDLETRLQCARPHHWPGQFMAVLELLQDEEVWLDDYVGGRVVPMLFGYEWNDESHADGLADIFVFELIDRRLLSHWREDNQSDEELFEFAKRQLTGEFVAFLGCWRESVVKAVESQRAKEASERKLLKIEMPQ